MKGGPPPPPPPEGDRLRFLMEKSKGASSGEEDVVAPEWLEYAGGGGVLGVLGEAECFLNLG